MALRKGDKMNYDTLIRACKAERLALIESRLAATGEYRALICAMDPPDKDGMILPSPLAVMVWDNPFESFVDPTQDTLPPEPKGEETIVLTKGVLKLAGYDQKAITDLATLSKLMAAPPLKG